MAKWGTEVDMLLRRSRMMEVISSLLCGEGKN
jgi:hypothetical protein